MPSSMPPRPSMCSACHAHGRRPRRSWHSFEMRALVQTSADSLNECHENHGCPGSAPGSVPLGWFCYPRRMLIHAYTELDAVATLDVFLRAIRTTASRDYSPEQIAVWAPGDTDLTAWNTKRTA